MSTVNTNKNRILGIGAVVLLFSVLWIFCSVRLAATEIYGFIIESVFFAVIYSLLLTDAPLIISLACLAVFCSVRGYMYNAVAGAEDEDFLLPVVYALPILFCIEQLYIMKRGETAFTKTVSWISRILPFVLLAWVVLYSFDERIEKYYRFLYCIVASVVVGIVYLVIFFLKEKQPASGKKKKKKQPVDENAFMRTSFVFAFVSCIVSCVFMLLNYVHGECIMYVAPILWLLNLTVLYSKGHPLTKLFFGNISRKVFPDSDA